MCSKGVFVTDFVRKAFNGIFKKKREHKEAKFRLKCLKRKARAKNLTLTLF